MNKNIISYVFFLCISFISFSCTDEINEKRQNETMAEFLVTEEVVAKIAINVFYNYSTVKQNLKNKQPVIIRASSKAGGLWPFIRYDGHAWVCDGMREYKTCFSSGGSSISLSFHMNWGWGGEYDGWYGFNTFNPGDANYKDNQRMVYNIRP